MAITVGEVETSTNHAAITPAAESLSNSEVDQFRTAIYVVLV